MGQVPFLFVIEGVFSLRGYLPGNMRTYTEDVSLRVGKILLYDITNATSDCQLKKLMPREHAAVYQDVIDISDGRSKDCHDDRLDHIGLREGKDFRI